MTGGALPQPEIYPPSIDRTVTYVPSDFIVVADLGLMGRSSDRKMGISSVVSLASLYGGIVGQSSNGLYLGLDGSGFIVDGATLNPGMMGRLKGSGLTGSGLGLTGSCLTGSCLGFFDGSSIFSLSMFASVFWASTELCA